MARLIRRKLIRKLQSFFRILGRELLVPARTVPILRTERIRERRTLRRDFPVRARQPENHNIGRRTGHAPGGRDGVEAQADGGDWRTVDFVHVLRHHACYGHREFLIAPGYKDDEIKRYLLERSRPRGDMTLHPARSEVLELRATCRCKLAAGVTSCLIAQRPAQIAANSLDHFSARNYEDGFSGTGAVARKSTRKRAE
jgi:hypothetical protein